MSTDRDTTRLVRSWLDEGVTKLPDRVLDAVLDQVPTTPQRRRFSSAWRPSHMNLYTKLAAAAAAVLVVAVVGYQLLPRSGSPGGQPTIAPSPSPSLLARGTFDAHGFNTTVNAVGAGSNVTGTMRVEDVANSQDFTVDLECERTINGLLWVAGNVTDSTFELAPNGSRAGIIFKSGTPVQALYFWQATDPDAASCQAFIDQMVAIGEDVASGLEPITGTIELRP